jgi:hypothetical protein
MAEDLIRYDILTQDALRGVVRKVLSEVSRTGLPGEHHFFISFLTRAPGVRVSSRLLAQYPDEVTIVIQHQYWELTVTEHAFEVGLSFNGVPERLLVPFTAVKGFFDPSVPFGLQIEPQAQKAVAAVSELPTAIEPAPRTLPAPAEAPAAEESESAPAGEAQIVRLDAFRKK